MVEEDRAGRAGHGRVHVGVGEHDVRRLAAQLQRDLLQVARRGLDDQLADLGGAGEGDLVDVRVRGQRRAGRLAVAGHDVDHAVGKPASMISSPRRSAVSGVCSAGLSTTVLPAGQRRPQLPGGHQQREVPRDDLPDHADRLAQRVGVEHRARGVGHRQRDRVALDLGGPAGHVVEQLGGQRHVDRAGDADRLAVVEGLQLGELLQVLDDQVAELPDQPPPLGRRSSPATARSRTPAAPPAPPGRCRPRRPARTRPAARRWPDYGSGRSAPTSPSPTSRQ